MMERYQGQNVQWTVGFSVGGKEGQTVQPCNQSSCILSVELGEEQKVTAEKVRVAAARAAKTLRDLKAETVVVDAGTVVRVLGPEGAGALSQGVELALFRTQSWKQTEPTDPTFTWTRRRAVTRP